MLRLGRGIRIQYERVSNSHLLLFPEGIVDLNQSAFDVLTLLPNTTATVRQTLQQRAGPTVPLDGFDAFVEHAVRQKWIVRDDPRAESATSGV